jgi:6-pyruvoyltetrahydropterin/6-carboxytetrahydropterin synthase
MYHASIQTQFSAAHLLRNYKGKCENLHGHNWKVEVTVSADILDEAGMAIDFTLLKQKTNDIIKQLDHQYLNEIPYFKNTNPSSENIAAYIFNLLKEKLGDTTVKLTKVSVWESENSMASYLP